MICGSFLSATDRSQLIGLARDGSAVSRLTRRANALVLLDDGWSCQQVAKALLVNDDTMRGWHKLFEQRGIEGRTSFDMGGSASFLSAAQEEALKAFVATTLRSTREVGAFIAREFGWFMKIVRAWSRCCIASGLNITSRRRLPASSMRTSKRHSSRAMTNY